MTATPQDMAKLDALISGKPEAPERIYGWLDSQLSIARFYGGCTYQCHSYVIDPIRPDPPLVRLDVLQREQKAAKEAEKAKRKAEKQAAKLAQEVLI